MKNHLSTVHVIKNTRDEMKFIPIKTAITKKTAGECLAHQVCLDGVSMNSCWPNPSSKLMHSAPWD